MDDWDMDTNYNDLIVFDSNNDGYSESTTISYDADGDGVEGGYLIESDTDGDGIVDTTSISYAIDLDGDGVVDSWRSDNYDDYWSGQDTPNSIDVATLSNLDEVSIASSQENFLAEETSVTLVGNPSCDEENWHQQSYDDTCAIVSQEFILDELTGEDFSEEQLRQEAIDKGYYTPNYGTSPENVGKLLEDYGFEVERTEGNTLEDLSAKLENGDKVIVALDADEIWNLSQDDYQEDYLEDYTEASACIPGQDCNHAVQVIGIDYSDPNNPMVILNDPGSPDGQGMMIPADEFVDAWADGNHYMVSTTGRSVETT